MATCVKIWSYLSSRSKILKLVQSCLKISQTCWNWSKHVKIRSTLSNLNQNLSKHLKPIKICQKLCAIKICHKWCLIIQNKEKHFHFFEIKICQNISSLSRFVKTHVLSRFVKNDVLSFKMKERIFTYCAPIQSERLFSLFDTDVSSSNPVKISSQLFFIWMFWNFFWIILLLPFYKNVIMGVVTTPCKKPFCQIGLNNRLASVWVMIMSWRPSRLPLS